MDSRLRTTIAVGAATLVPLVLYLASERPSVDYWDTADMQTVPYILGIPYPTGFPGYVLVGWAWSHAFAVGDVAWRMNVLSSVALAGASGTLALVAIEVGVIPELAAGAGIAAALGHAAWQLATHADAHALGALAVTVALLFALRWRTRASERDLDAAALAAAAALAVDNTTLLPLAGVAVAALARPIEVKRFGSLVVLVVAVVAIAYAYLPARSAYVTAHRVDPTLALGLPPGRPFWDDHHPADWRGFIDLTTGSEFHTDAAFYAVFSARPWTQLARRWFPALRRDFAYGSALLGIAGAVLLAFRDPWVALAIVMTGGFPLVFASAYRVEAQVERYYVVAACAVALLVAYTLDTVVRAIDRGPRQLATVFAIALMLGIGVHELSVNRGFFAQRNDDDARRFIARVVAHTDPRAIVIAPWAYATPLAYSAYVEHGLAGRTLVTAWPSDVVDRVPAWRRERPVVVILAKDAKVDVEPLRLRALDRGDPVLYAVER